MARGVASVLGDLLPLIAIVLVMACGIWIVWRQARLERRQQIMYEAVVGLVRAQEARDDFEQELIRQIVDGEEGGESWSDC